MEMYDGKVNIMKKVLIESKIEKVEYIKGYPTYTFSDNSYIMFHGKDYTIAYATD